MKKHPRKPGKGAAKPADDRQLHAPHPRTTKKAPEQDSMPKERPFYFPSVGEKEVLFPPHMTQRIYEAAKIAASLLPETVKEEIMRAENYDDLLENFGRGWRNAVYVAGFLIQQSHLMHQLAEYKKRKVVEKRIPFLEGIKQITKQTRGDRAKAKFMEIFSDEFPTEKFDKMQKTGFSEVEIFMLSMIFWKKKEIQKKSKNS